MKYCLVFAISCFIVGYASGVAVLTLLEVSASTLELLEKIAEAWNILDEYGSSVNITFQSKENLILEKIDAIDIQLSDISEILRQTDAANRILGNQIKKLPSKIRYILYFNDITKYQYYIDDYYKKFQKYIGNFNKYEQETLLDYASSVTSSKINSVSSLMGEIYSRILSEEFLKLIFNQFTDTSGDIFCGSAQSPQQMYLNFLNRLLHTHKKSHVVIQFSYLIKKLFNKGNFTQEALDATDDFKQRTDMFITIFKSYMNDASQELWRCDPARHKLDDTYATVTNLFRGYIVNQQNLDRNKNCYEKCDHFSNTRNQVNCPRNDRWCHRSGPTCNKILECFTLPSDTEVCLGNPTDRRYEYMEMKNGRKAGKKIQCEKRDMFQLSSHKSQLFWECSFCFCLCDEGPIFYSDRFINLRSVISNIKDNKVVTGLRFVKQNRLIHIQIQEGKLLPHGRIDNQTVSWRPIENYKITDTNVYEEQDYHKLTWDERSIDLNTVMAKKGSLVTGLRLRRVGQRLELEILSTPFNYASGELQIQRSIYEDDNNIVKHKFGKELKLIRPDISTRTRQSSVPNYSGDFVKFVNTDFYKDAAQTTVPFFDAQPVESVVPVPISGVGIFYKGISGYGGFIAPKIYTYDYCNHINTIFNKTV